MALMRLWDAPTRLATPFNEGRHSFAAIQTQQTQK
jgi:hypothetical protein